MIRKIAALALVMGLLAESQAVAVKPFQISAPMPSLSVKVPSTNIVATALNGVMTGLETMKNLTDMMPMPSSGDGNMFSMEVTAPDLSIMYPTQMAIGMLSRTGDMAVDMSGFNFTMIMNARMTPAGACEMGMEVVPSSMSPGVNMDALKPLSNFITSATSIFTNFVNLLMANMTPPMMNNIKNAMTGLMENVPGGMEAMCKSMAENVTPMNPLSYMR